MLRMASVSNEDRLIHPDQFARTYDGMLNRIFDLTRPSKESRGSPDDIAALWELDAECPSMQPLLVARRRRFARRFQAMSAPSNITELWRFESSIRCILQDGSRPIRNLLRLLDKEMKRDLRDMDWWLVRPMITLMYADHARWRTKTYERTNPRPEQTTDEDNESTDQASSRVPYSKESGSRDELDDVLASRHRTLRALITKTRPMVPELWVAPLAAYFMIDQKHLKFEDTEHQCSKLPALSVLCAVNQACQRWDVEKEPNRLQSLQQSPKWQPDWDDVWNDMIMLVENLQSRKSEQAKQVRETLQAMIHYHSFISSWEGLHRAWTIDDRIDLNRAFASGYKRMVMKGDGEALRSLPHETIVSFLMGFLRNAFLRDTHYIATNSERLEQVKFFEDYLKPSTPTLTGLRASAQDDEILSDAEVVLRLDEDMLSFFNKDLRMDRLGNLEMVDSLQRFLDHFEENEDFTQLVLSIFSGMTLMMKPHAQTFDRIGIASIIAKTTDIGADEVARYGIRNYVTLRYSQTLLGAYAPQSNKEIFKLLTEEKHRDSVPQIVPPAPLQAFLAYRLDDTNDPHANYTLVDVNQEDIQFVIAALQRALMWKKEQLKASDKWTPSERYDFEFECAQWARISRVLEEPDITREFMSLVKRGLPNVQEGKASWTERQLKESILDSLAKHPIPSLGKEALWTKPPKILQQQFDGVLAGRYAIEFDGPVHFLVDGKGKLYLRGIEHREKILACKEAGLILLRFCHFTFNEGFVYRDKVEAKLISCLRSLEQKEEFTPGACYIF
eukprot:Clim_evm26s191 gene=Clim_evmTU26s191